MEDHNRIFEKKNSRFFSDKKNEVTIHGEHLLKVYVHFYKPLSRIMQQSRGSAGPESFFPD